MNERRKVAVLAGLAVVLAAVLAYSYFGGSTISVGAGSSATASYHAMDIDNPALHLDRIERLRKLEYRPTGRDIFSASLPPPPAPKPDPHVPPPKGPDLPPPPPALTVPFKYFGFSDDVAIKKRRGFFSNGDDVIIAAEGEIILGKYRVVSISAASAEVEEVSTSRHATLAMEGASSNQPGASQER
jgi:hypothetical protein